MKRSSAWASNACSNARQVAGAFSRNTGCASRTPRATSNYFAALQSARRGAVLRAVNLTLLTAAHRPLHDRLAAIPELAQYECFTQDGHWHQAATHDPRHEGAKLAVGHFYSLNLRTQLLEHLAAGQGLHEHDMSALKRIKPKGLRQRVPKGKRVICIYDKAGIDFHYWKRCRQECAVYFLSRVKENMVYDWLESVPWDESDPRNAGVTEDRQVRTREGHALRIVYYTDPLTGERYEFLTNEMDLPPGVIAELYRRRWEVEKVFDEIKNKLTEKKAWATSLVAKDGPSAIDRDDAQSAAGLRTNVGDRARGHQPSRRPTAGPTNASGEHEMSAAGQSLSPWWCKREGPPSAA